MSLKDNSALQHLKAGVMQERSYTTSEVDALRQQVRTLKMALRLKDAHHQQMLDSIKAEHQQSIEHLKLQANNWRASSENEFCRLVTCCTRQLTAMQEKYDKVLKEKAFIAQQLMALKQS